VGGRASGSLRDLVLATRDQLVSIVQKKGMHGAPDGKGLAQDGNGYAALASVSAL